MINRRDFTKITASLAVSSSFTNPFNYIRHLGASRINIGVIGCNGMGWANTTSLLKDPNVYCTGICDIDDAVIARRVADYKEYRDNTPTTYTDYRKLLEDKDIDAVVIGTPDHWHCKMFCDALEAGKHIYVEKPLANSIGEAFVMRKAAANHENLIVQVGQWQRSGTHYDQAINIVRSGSLGNIRLVKTWAYQGWMKPMEPIPDSPVPEGVDYAMWLGPAPTRPFNKNRFHFNFRWFWDYAGGLMTDWGVHEIDIALYAMNVEFPKSVMASGGKLAYPNDPAETPDTLQAVFEYEGFNMLWEHATGIDQGPYGKTEGIAFIGNNGTLVVNRGGVEIIEEFEGVNYSTRGRSKMDQVMKVEKTSRANYLDLHTQNFLEAIRSNDPSKLKTPVDSGSLAAINAHMGNVAFKTGSKIYWDKEAHKFNLNAADELITSAYHNEWTLPDY